MIAIAVLMVLSIVVPLALGVPIAAALGLAGAAWLVYLDSRSLYISRVQPALFGIPQKAIPPPNERSPIYSNGGIDAAHRLVAALFTTLSLPLLVSPIRWCAVCKCRNLRNCRGCERIKCCNCCDGGCCCDPEPAPALVMTGSLFLGRSRREGRLGNFDSAQYSVNYIRRTGR